MSDLTDFLLREIAADEEMARAATQRPVPSDADAVYVRWSRYDTGWVPAASGEWTEGTALFARWDPARALAECEAKRRIVERESRWMRQKADAPVAATRHTSGDKWVTVTYYDGSTERMTTTEHNERFMEPVLTETLRLLALPYADRPGYREEWRPE